MEQGTVHSEPFTEKRETILHLEAVRVAGETLQINVLGLASIADDVSSELALATIDSVVVLGAFRASPEVKAALAGRVM